MVEAVRTTASPGAIWAIVIVAVVVLAVWLAGMFVADHMQARASGRAKAALWPSYMGPWAVQSEAGEKAPEIPAQAAREPAGARGGHAGDGSASQGDAPTRSDIPAQSAGSGRHEVPTQRSGDSDRAERTYTGSGYAGQGTPDEEDPGR